MLDEGVVARLRAAGCVFAEDEARLIRETARTPAELTSMVERRVAGLPLEHVLGWAEFAGLRVRVDPGVFVPRHRSEFLVVTARRQVRPGGVVVDLCCGTGALGLAVVAGVDGVELHAADLDPAAVACARRNVEPAGRVHRGDLFAALPTELRGRVDVLLASPPYVPTEAIALMPPEARDHEPRTALDGGGDGLDLVRRIAAGAPHWLRDDRGILLLELSAAQAAAAVDAVREAGLVAADLHDDEWEATVVTGRRGRSETGSRHLRSG
ncbi:putative protein N(5)-glutamine methyltransferase [Jiangella ureilytica]|uniref:peptide chain release factor N(5)-glutamine methyltransferase n=1 Tax=Jiangella ureilytica TaxID=2530374 RepID=A0A4R4RPH7_9ACTN|nr:putative protein N(5)-glutamine methyltransferase [Jiangella ureilytica]TDC51737.1 putative protein N(5)-glutamine methyltransferase [Jiangella ureilytica]